MNSKSNRSIKADVIRGFAIISVILGHCIQQGNGIDYYNNAQYWFNKLYQFIYSFHMPLFMMLAGWFAYYSLKKYEGNRSGQWKMLIKKAFMYVFPIIFWTLFEFVRGYIININLGNENAPISDLVPQFFSYLITNLWFLWAILICLIVVFVMHYYLKDNIIIYALGFLGMFIITDEMNLGVYKYLLPYYVGAFYLNMNKEKVLNCKVGNSIKKVYEEKKWIVLIGLGVIFALLFSYFNDMVFIYRSGYRISRATLIKQTVLDMYRMIIGFIGSGFFIVLFDCITEKCKSYKWPVLTAFGRNSLGIYILQGYYILLVMTKYTNNLEPAWWIVAIETIIICIISLFSAIILGKVPIVRGIVGKGKRES